MRELQRSHAQITLADAEVHGLAGEPSAVRGAGKCLGFPLPRGQEAGLLAADVYPRRLAEAERRHESCDPVDPQHVGKPVEVHVARARDCILEIHTAVLAALALPEQVSAARKMKHARAEAPLLRIDHVIREAG